MNNPNTIENQVHSILQENMKAQNDDMKLYLLVCNRCYQRYEKQDVGTLPFAVIMNCYKELHLPHFESVRRSRAKLQVAYPELAPSPDVQRGRKRCEHNWVVQNFQNALDTWNSKLAEIWQLLTTSPQQFKGRSIWSVMVNINGAVQAIGLALLVLFFVVGVVRTCGSFTDVKKPEHALKLFIRFAIAKGVITYGLELMLALFNIVQGTISTIMTSAGFGTPNQTTLPAEMITKIEECGFF